MGDYDSGTKSKVKLEWDGASTSDVDIYRDDNTIKTTANDGA